MEGAIVSYMHVQPYMSRAPSDRNVANLTFDSHFYVISLLGKRSLIPPASRETPSLISHVGQE